MTKLAAERGGDGNIICSDGSLEAATAEMAAAGPGTQFRHETSSAPHRQYVKMFQIVHYAPNISCTWLVSFLPAQDTRKCYQNCHKPDNMRLSFNINTTNMSRWSLKYLTNWLSFRESSRRDSALVHSFSISPKSLLR